MPDGSDHGSSFRPCERAGSRSPWPNVVVLGAPERGHRRCLLYSGSTLRSSYADGSAVLLGRIGDRRVDAMSRFTRSG